MKKNIPTFIYLLFLSIGVKAQEKDKALAQAKYAFIHINDTNQKDIPYKEDMLLLIGQRATIYKSYTSILAKEDTERQFAAQKGNSDILIHRNTGGKEASNASLYHFPLESKYLRTDNIASTYYLIEEKYPRLAWTISEETKEIGGYPCQKATTQFAGRNYTVWFAPALPFPYGAWKLHGLPGLVLEAFDEKKEVLFHYLGFETLDGEKQESITLPDNLATADSKSFDRAKEAQLKNPSAGMTPIPRSAARSDMSQRTSTNTDLDNLRSVTIKADPVVADAVKKKNNNNPMELTSY